MQGFLCGRDGADAHVTRVNPCVCVSHKAGQGFHALCAHGIALHQDDGGGGIVDARGIASGHRPALIAVKYEGPDVNIAFNPQYIIDPLKALTEDEIDFEFKDEMSPGVIRGLKDDFLCVVMPQRIS